MASPVKIYQAEMHNNLGFFATWLPADQNQIGDLGVLVDGRFRRMSSLKDMGIKFAEDDVGAPQDIQVTSTNGTKVDTKASADVVGMVNAEIKIDFSANGAFVFHATGLQARRIEDLAAVGKGVLAAHERGDWRKEWLIVEAVHEATCATIIVSQDTAASLVLTAKMNAPASILSLADPKVGLEVSSSRGQLVHAVGGKSLKPLYSCVRLHTSFFGAPSLQPARGTGHQTGEFERASIRDLLEG